MDNGEATLATYPAAIAREDARIVKHGGLVKENASTVYGAGKGHFIWMEVFKARPAEDLCRRISEDIGDGVGREENIGFWRQVYMSSSQSVEG